MEKMTNAQVALMAAATNISSHNGANRLIIRYAEDFLEWLEEHTPKGVDK